MLDDYTPYQQKIIKRYYGNQDTIQRQRLAELVTELYLSDGAKRQRAWKSAVVGDAEARRAAIADRSRRQAERSGAAGAGRQGISKGNDVHGSSGGQHAAAEPAGLLSGLRPEGRRSPAAPNPAA